IEVKTLDSIAKNGIATDRWPYGTVGDVNAVLAFGVGGGVALDERVGGEGGEDVPGAGGVDIVVEDLCAGGTGDADARTGDGTGGVIDREPFDGHVVGGPFDVDPVGGGTVATCDNHRAGRGVGIGF